MQIRTVYGQGLFRFFEMLFKLEDLHREVSGTDPFFILQDMRICQKDMQYSPSNENRLK